ncbi:MAG: WD40 repeat domain-containing protein [Pirellulales bacterium]|nr:WD40 repeat domain-containing protein [Pirellulales bacterium]
MAQLPETPTDELKDALEKGYGGPERKSVGMTPDEQIFKSKEGNVYVVPGCRNPSYADVSRQVAHRVRGVTAPCFFGAGSSLCFFDGKSSVVDLRTGEKIGSVNYPIGHNRAMALSADGRAMAIARDRQGNARPMIDVYAVRKGEVIRELDPNKKNGNPQSIQSLAFVGKRELACHLSEEVVVIEVISKKVVRRLPVTSSVLVSSAFSADGHYFAMINEGALEWYDLRAGRMLGRLLPSAQEGLAEEKLAEDTCIAFSPSGEEVAVVTENGRLLSWDSTGKRTFNLVVESHVGSNAMLAWMPDGQGWLVAGRTLVMREPAMAVWRIHGMRGMHMGIGLRGSNLPRFVGRNEVIVPRDVPGGTELIQLKVPWEAIKASLAALAPGADPLVRPAQAVKRNIHGTTTQEGLAWTQALLDMNCLRAGHQIAENAPYALDANPVEIEGGGFLITPDRPGKSVTRMPGKKRTLYELRLTARDSGDVFWRKPATLPGMPALIVSKGQPSDARQLVDELTHAAIAECDIPSLIPKQPTIPQLPLVTSIR